MSNVYIVEVDGERCLNWGTGTRVYTRLHNAARLAGKYGLKDKRQVIEYELVPTGRKFNGKGELIE